MTTDSEDRPTTSNSGMPRWLKRVIMFAILGAVLVIVYFILAAFLPRWWAERIGELADRDFARDITSGLLFGGVFAATGSRLRNMPMAPSDPVPGIEPSPLQAGAPR